LSEGIGLTLTTQDFVFEPILSSSVFLLDHVEAIEACFNLSKSAFEGTGISFDEGSDDMFPVVAAPHAPVTGAGLIRRMGFFDPPIFFFTTFFVLFVVMSGHSSAGFLLLLRIVSSGVDVRLAMFPSLFTDAGTSSRRIRLFSIPALLVESLFSVFTESNDTFFFVFFLATSTFGATCVMAPSVGNASS
jgi:hypothetical protein